jgi:7-cyano-7-deazaguanine synthase in queuosine biosynthesis
LPRPQGRAGARLFQQPDLENHWVPMRNRALPSVLAFVAQATGFRNAEWGIRNAECGRNTN